MAHSCCSQLQELQQRWQQQTLLLRSKPLQSTLCLRQLLRRRHLCLHKQQLKGRRWQRHVTCTTASSNRWLHPTWRSLHRCLRQPHLLLKQQ
jgi:hypothetical protein